MVGSAGDGGCEVVLLLSTWRISGECDVACWLKGMGVRRVELVVVVAVVGDDTRRLILPTLDLFASPGILSGPGLNGRLFICGGDGLPLPFPAIIAGCFDIECGELCVGMRPVDGGDTPLGTGCDGKPKLLGSAGPERWYPGVVLLILSNASATPSS